VKWDIAMILLLLSKKELKKIVEENKCNECSVENAKIVLKDCFHI
jgi:hypothetical protein